MHENASIAYSPASTAQFNALAQLAADGLIPGVPSIAVPQNVPIPFRDYIGSLRFDWAQSSKSQWFLRTSARQLPHAQRPGAAGNAALDRTDHAQQLLEHSAQQYIRFQSDLARHFGPRCQPVAPHADAQLGSRLRAGVSLQFDVRLTVSGFETFGDNQFATPITLFPTLRNQDKYQVRYDLSHATGDHSLKFGVNFIHEPVLSGAFAATAEQFIVYPNNPDVLRRRSNRQFYFIPPISAVQSAARSGFRHQLVLSLLPATDAFRRTFRDSDSTPRIPGEFHITSPSTTDCAIRPPSDCSQLQAAARLQIPLPYC